MREEKRNRRAHGPIHNRSRAAAALPRTHASSSSPISQPRRRRTAHNASALPRRCGADQVVQGCRRLLFPTPRPPTGFASPSLPLDEGSCAGMQIEGAEQKGLTMDAQGGSLNDGLLRAVPLVKENRSPDVFCVGRRDHLGVQGKKARRTQGSQEVKWSFLETRP
ncbi:uncharacterized protein LOC124672840 [Lolium rigidum]|uniref:uncharacterized protein LOC124672840 n=1 Tax=Lolium rigidum TaxID=89674 RepID=UPI001F5DB5CE|nr:uncharacterized protein LOC124672840 [Lolium rigidum]